MSFFVAYGSETIASATHALVFENVVKPRVLKEKGDLQKIEHILQTELPAILDYLETTLSDGRAWIANTDGFSLADIVAVSHLMTLDSADLPDVSAESSIGKKRPYLLSYYQKAISRASFQTALSD